MYPIVKFNRRRFKTDYIILTHSINLIEKFYIDPLVYQSSYHYTWGIWQRYFLEDLKKPSLPCHYYTELLDKDYVIYKGLNEAAPSYFIEDLVSSGIIDYKYLNSMVIMIGDNYTEVTTDTRMVQHLSEKVICPLLRQYGLDFTKVKYIDDCLKPEWETNLAYSNLNYKFTKQKYFDINQVIYGLKKYKK